jgi:replicative DNA helicase
MTLATYYNDAPREAALLGYILQHNDVLDRYKVERDLFYEENHRQILDEIVACRERGASGDIYNVGMSRPDLVVQIASLTSLGVSDVQGCLDALRACVQARGVASMLREVSELQNNMAESAEVIEAATRKVIALTECHDVHYRPFNEVMVAAIEAIGTRMACKEAYSGIDTGIEQLDSWTDGFQNGDYIVLGARPSVGKTAFALAVSRHAASKGHKVGFLSLEMSDVALMLRYLAAQANIPLNAIRAGLLSPKMKADLFKAGEDLNGSPLLFADAPNMGINDLIAEARILKSREKIEFLVIDYMGLISASVKGDTPRWEAFSAISQQIKSLARELKIPILLLSQLRRDAEGKRPNLADLRETGSIEQDADVIMFLHKDEKEKGQDGRSPVKIILAKQRNGETGDIDLIFDKPRMRFYPVDYGK